jgi:hypothetical protein
MSIAHHRQLRSAALLLVAALCLIVLAPTPTASAAGATLVQIINHMSQYERAFQR